MEEAWELAVVSKVSTTEPNSARLKYNDLQDSTYAANTKFELISLTSITVSVLELSCDSSIFGLRFDSLHERWIEVGFFAAALALALNYWLRYADEGKALTNIENELSQLKLRINASIDEIQKSLKVKDVFENAKNNLSNLSEFSESTNTLETPVLLGTVNKLNSYLAKADKERKRAAELYNMPADFDPHAVSAADASVHESNSQIFKDDAKRELGKLKDEISNVELLSNDLQVLINDLEINHQEITERIYPLPHQLNSKLKYIEEQLEGISTKLIKTDVRPARAKLRIRIFMMYWPCVLVLLVILGFGYAWLTQTHQPCNSTLTTACVGALI